MFKDYPDIMTIPQVAQALRIGRKAAYGLVKNNKLGHLRVGKTILVPKEMLVEFVKTARNNIVL